MADLRYNLGFDKDQTLKNVCNALNGTDTTDMTINGDVTMSGTLTKASQVIQYNAFQINATWTIGTDGTLRLAASQTGKVAIIPLPGLKVGDAITQFKIYGQIESGGNNVKLDADLRKVTHAAADVTDASVASITQVSKSADYDVEETATVSATVTAEYGYYIKITGTTTAATDIAIVSAELTVNRI